MGATESESDEPLLSSKDTQRDAIAASPRLVSRGSGRNLGSARLNSLRSSIVARRKPAAEVESRPVDPLYTQNSHKSSQESQTSHHRSRGLQEGGEEDVAFTILIRKDVEDGGEPATGLEEASLDVAHEVVSEAVQDVCSLVIQACGQVVQEAVQGAIQQVLEDNMRFDVRANVFTLIAITGVILFWRGIWSLWDKVFGFSIWSELGSIAAGLGTMVTFRLIGVPLLDGLPSG